MRLETPKEPSFKILRPQRALSGVVFASPHSGRDYPAALIERTILSMRQLRSSEDAFVDRLASAAPDLGAPLIAAQIPRAYVDFNRGADELDPALIEGVSSSILNARVRAGLGVVPRVVAGARAIYAGKIPRAEVDRRIAAHWQPYHQAIETLMTQALTDHGRAVLIDLHSMPSEALDQLSGRPQIVLGDRFGTSSGPQVVDMVERAFTAEGFVVARNRPFAGAFIAQSHGRPTQGRHVVQVEIDRGLYMDETQICPRGDFDRFADRIKRVIGRIIHAEATRLPMAAQ